MWAGCAAAMEMQIPPLRYGMTKKCAADGKKAALRNDKSCAAERQTES
jgi:hypothetical protein